jgi:hypothetical protein
MSLNSRCTRAGGLALAYAAFMVGPAVAEQANLKSMDLSIHDVSGAIHVISTDKKKWNAIKPGTVSFRAHMSVDLRWPGFVDEVGIALGICGPGQCVGFPTLWSTNPDSRDYEATETVQLDPASMPLSDAGGIAVVPYASQILEKCNAHLQADGPTKSYLFTQALDATFAARTDKTLNLHGHVEEVTGAAWPEPVYGAHYTAHDSFNVQVVCDPVVKPAADDLAHDFGEFDVENVKLFLTTYQSNQPGSTPGTVCPALKVTSRAKANQSGPVTMRIWRQKDAGPVTSDVVQAWASYDAVKNGYFATYE